MDNRIGRKLRDRRKKIAELYLAGWTLDGIAGQVGGRIDRLRGELSRIHELWETSCVGERPKTYIRQLAVTDAEESGHLERCDMTAVFDCIRERLVTLGLLSNETTQGSHRPLGLNADIVGTAVENYEELKADYVALSEFSATPSPGSSWSNSEDPCVGYRL